MIFSLNLIRCKQKWFLLHFVIILKTLQLRSTYGSSLFIHQHQYQSELNSMLEKAMKWRIKYNLKFVGTRKNQELIFDNTKFSCMSFQNHVSSSDFCYFLSFPVNEKEKKRLINNLKCNHLSNLFSFCYVEHENKVKQLKWGICCTQHLLNHSTSIRNMKSHGKFVFETHN